MAERKPPDPEPEEPSRRPWWQALFGTPQDTPDCEPDDWLFVDSTGYRIPFEEKPSEGEDAPSPPEEPSS